MTADIDAVGGLDAVIDSLPPKYPLTLRDWMTEREIS